MSLLVLFALGGLLVLEGIQGEACGCTTDTLPHPRIVLLGPTGVGKSTFGNRLLGLPRDDKEKEALCGQVDHFGTGPFRFGVGHGAESHTNATSWMVGHYLGDPSNPCITIIDSPGTGDTEGRDCDHGIALAKGIKEIGSIDAFMLLFKGNNARFSTPMQEQIKLYKNIFGDKMFDNVITEFTFWSHDGRSIRERSRNFNGLNDEKKHDIWNREYANRFRVPRIIPSVFIDPVYDAEFADDTETEINQRNTEKLWELITKNFTRFPCDKRCKAPSGFFSGQPFLFEENELQNKRVGDRAALTWQIWFAGCDGSGTKSYTISHQTLEGKEATLYEHRENEDGEKVIDETRLLKGMNVEDDPAEKFKTIRMTIQSVEDQHIGSYYIKNDKGESNLGQLEKIVDGEWEAWSKFGDCSKTCILGDEKPGIMRRSRVCKPPQNGGLDCRGKNMSERSCAHLPGEDGEVLRQCPVDAKWSSWSADWSQCNSNCREKGEQLPFRSRSRVCQPDQYGGKNCTSLEEETKQKKEPLYTETQDCTELPNCPDPASMGPWGSWSECTQDCFPEGEAPPQRSRVRSCNEATLSTDSTLNEDVATCESLGEQEVFQNCPDVTACPVDGEWTDWNSWGDCNSSCGPDGTRSRTRGYEQGRHGGQPKPDGDQEEKESCNTDVPCPVAATWTWGEWSSCNINCYRGYDGDRGVRTRNNTCQEEENRHEYLNCDYAPKEGWQDTERPCPGIPRCPSLSRVEAYVSDVTDGGTDDSVYLSLRNGNTGEQCKTNVLDSKGNSWYRGYWEKYNNEWNELDPCGGFYPKAGSFQFSLTKGGIDGVAIDQLHLWFGDKKYSWSGQAQFFDADDIWKFMN